MQEITGGIAPQVNIDFSGNDYVSFVDNCFVIEATKTVTASINGSQIPEGIKEIGSRAFKGVKMKSFSLPSTLEKISDSAFVEITLASGEYVSVNLTSNRKTGWFYAWVNNFCSCVGAFNAFFAVRIQNICDGRFCWTCNRCTRVRDCL